MIAYVTPERGGRWVKSHVRLRDGNSIAVRETTKEIATLLALITRRHREHFQEVVPDGLDTGGHGLDPGIV